MAKTYSGWTQEEIYEAEENGDYIPSIVLIDFSNDEPDEED